MKHKLTKKSDVYKIEDGKITKTKRFCPKCGPGVFMADHGSRVHCGRCGYTEFVVKAKPEKEEAPQAESPKEKAEKPKKKKSKG